MNYDNINNWLTGELEKLDISPTNFKKAKDRYMALGKTIEESLKNDYEIESHIYVQGSFMIGTVVKPYGKEKEYDVDLVCECNLKEYDITSKELKILIGKIIKSNGIYGKMIDEEEGRRTWTVNYAEDDNLSFHIDIQPSIPDEHSSHNHAILTTTRIKNSSDYIWDKGNPLGFKDWFDAINSESFNSIQLVQKRKLFESNSFLFESVDDIPNQLVVTKLQRLIQILKRHRDIRFENSDYKDDKPKSMIITILATNVFQGCDSNLSLYELLKVFSEMLFANKEFLVNSSEDTNDLLVNRINGKYVVPNPSVEENLAERWNVKDNNKATAFFEWCNWLNEDIKKMYSSSSLFVNEKRSFDNVFKELSIRPLEILKNDNANVSDEIKNTVKPWKKNE